eukprot:5341316-Amphidinium_carterae.1
MEIPREDPRQGPRLGHIPVLIHVPASPGTWCWEHEFCNVPPDGCEANTGGLPPEFHLNHRGQRVQNPRANALVAALAGRFTVDAMVPQHPGHLFESWDNCGGGPLHAIFSQNSLCKGTPVDPLKDVLEVT